MSPPTSVSSVCSSSPAPHRSTTAAATSPDTSRLRIAAARRCRGPALGRHHAGERRARRLPRGNQAEHDAHRQRRGQTEQHDPHVERGRHRRRQQTRRNQRRRGPEDRGADADAQRPAKHREHQALGEQLPDDASALGAERGAHGNLTGARRRPREQQVGDVRTAQEQHEAHHAQQEHRRRLQVAADDAGADRFDDDAGPLVRFGILAREPVGDDRPTRPGRLPSSRRASGARRLRTRVPRAARGCRGTAARASRSRPDARTGRRRRRRRPPCRAGRSSARGGRRSRDRC